MPDPLAIYAAAIGTAAAAGALWNIYDSSIRERPRLNVVGTRGVVAQPPTLASIPGQLRHGEKLIMVEAVNVGRRMITIQEAGIVLKNKQKLAFIGSGRDVPKEVSAGQSFSISTRADQLTDDLNDAAPAYPYCRDAEGKTYKGKFHQFFWNWYHDERNRG